MAELNDRTNRERVPETSCQAQTNKAPSQLRQLVLGRLPQRKLRQVT